DKIKIKHIAADRGNILDGTGAPLTTKQRTITIRVQPGEVADVDGTVRVLTAAFQSIKADIGDIDLTDLPQKIKAGGTAPIAVISLREPVYNKIRSTIHELNGLYFPDSYRMLTPTTTFGKALLGRVGDVTDELMKQNLGKYQIGDQVGLGGLQQRFEGVLGGSPGVDVVIPGKDPGGKDPGKVLFHSDPKPGGTVRTTLDQRVQKAAEDALSGQQRRSALVAIRVSDGSVLAVANGPDGGDLDLALTAQVAPGSTFTTVT